MAEVKRGNGIPSLPLKKPVSFSHTSSSYKHIYDDVFASPLQSRQQSSTFIDDDYAEMFGSSRSNNGTWSISYSSIPVLDLPPPSDMRVRGASGVTTVSGETGGGNVDYSGVFGGFGDGNFGLPDGEELFDQFKKTSTSSNVIPRSNVRTVEATRPEIRQSQNGRSSTNTFSQSSDNLHNFEPKINGFEGKKSRSAMKKSGEMASMKKSGEMASMKKSGEMASMKKSGEMASMKKSGEIIKKSGEIAKVVHDRDFPVAPQKMKEPIPNPSYLSSKTPVIKDGTQLGEDSYLADKRGKHSRHSSTGIGSNVHKQRKYDRHTSMDDASFLKMPEFGTSDSVDAMKKSGEIAKVVQARDFPVAPQKMEEPIPNPSYLSSKSHVIRDDTQLGEDSYLADKRGKHSKHSSTEIGANVHKQGKYDRHTSMDDASFLKMPEFGTSDSVDAAHDTSQPYKGSTEDLFSQPSDGTKNFDHLNPELRNSSHHTSQPATGSTILFAQPSDSTKHFDDTNMHDAVTSEEIRTADVHVNHESTSTLHEVDCNQSNLSSETSVLKDDTETKMDVDTEEKHESEPSFDASQDTSQPSSEVGRSKTVDDDVGISYYVRKKKGRHSRMTSLDLGDRKSPREQDERLHRKPRFGGSYSFDASHDPHSARVKVQPSMMAPSSSVPQFFPVESHYKISENSSWRNFGPQVYKNSAVSPPFLDEQLDMNSDAGVSVAALQKAIEEASVIIQMAKEYLEQEGQGSKNVRFKDTLKVKPLHLADEIDEFQQTMTQVNRLQADNVKQKLALLKDGLKVKVQKDYQFSNERNTFKQTTIHEICTPAGGENQRHSALERTNGFENGQPSPASEDPKNENESVVQGRKKFVMEGGPMEETMRNNNDRPSADSGNERPLFTERNSILDNSQPSPISEDPKKFSQEEECIEERNPNMSNLINERDRQEGGGEWEAAKHLNQLISGVKNKLASFMTWQTDTEKKEEPKEIEASTKYQLQAEEVESGVIDVVNTEMKAAEKNQDDTGFPEEHVEIEIGFLSETVEPDENESFGSNTTEQGKADSSVVASPSTNFVFCPFRKEEVHTDSEEESDKRSKERIEIEFLKARVEELNEMNYEQLQDKGEEHCTLQDSVPQADLSYDSEETIDMVEEPYVLADKDVNEWTDEKGSCRSLDESREDVVHDSDYADSTTERMDDHGKPQEDEVPMKSENEKHDADILEEADIEEEMGKCIEATKGTHGCQEIEKDPSQNNRIEEAAGRMHGFNEFIVSDALTDSDEGAEEYVSGEASSSEIDKKVFVQPESSCMEVTSDEMGEEASSIPAGADEHTPAEKGGIEDTLGHVAQQATCFASVEDDCQQIENVCSSEAVGPCVNDDISAEVEKAVSPDEEISNPCLEPSLNKEETVLFYDSFVELDGIIDDLDVKKTIQSENCVLHGSQSDVYPEKEEIDSSAMVTEYEGVFENQTEAKHVHDSVKTLNGRNMCPEEEEVDVNAMETDYDNILGNQTNDVRDSEETLNVGEVKEEVDVNAMETDYDNILQNQTTDVHDSEETNVREVDNSGVQEVEKSGVEAVQKRRRWFDNAVKVGPTGRPSILEGNITEVESDQEKLDESVLAGSVEIHADVLDSDKQDVIYSKEPNFVANPDGGNINVESTPKRRRWSVKIGEEGLPVPPPLFQDMNVNLEEPPEIVNEALPHSKSESSLDKVMAESRESLNATEVDVDGEKDKKSEAPSRRKRWFGNGESVGPATQLRNDEDAGIALGVDNDSNVVKDDIENHKRDSIPTVEEIEVEPSIMEPVNDRLLDEVKRKEKEREKERKAVEKVIREARERAFVEAKERARRDASDRPNVEARQKVASGGQETAAKAPAEARVSSDKSSVDAKLRAERAAVERATSEARERALQKSLSDKASHKSREQAGKIPAEKNTSSDPSFQSSSSFSRGDSSNKGEKYDGPDSESAQRRKARSERQSRPMERPATALDEKNQRDILIQKEQAAKNMMEESLDAEVKRWSAGKEGNLRLLLCTLQLILGADSGWQTVTLTDLMATTALRKAYKKANLCVHPDKLQQRGATIEQKYICEKVFELLKDAWSKLNPDD